MLLFLGVDNMLLSKGRDIRLQAIHVLNTELDKVGNSVLHHVFQTLLIFSNPSTPAFSEVQI